MSKEKGETETKIATLEDLLGDPSEKTTITYIEPAGASIKIKRLTLGDLAKIEAYNRSKGWEGDAYRSTIGILTRGVVEPKLSYSQAEGLDVDKATAIVTAISEFSGFNEEAMEQARNLSEPTTEST